MNTYMPRIASLSFMVCCLLFVPALCRAQSDEGDGSRTPYKASRLNAVLEQQKRASSPSAASQRKSSVGSAAATRPPQGKATTKRRGESRNHPAQNNHSEIAKTSTKTAIVDDTSTEFIGIGYTILLKRADGNFAVVPANHVFRSGDAIRIRIESSMNGYLYVLHEGNDSQLRLLFPFSPHSTSPSVFANRHYTLPDPQDFEFIFDDKPVTENITLIVSRQRIKHLEQAVQTKSKQRSLSRQSLLAYLRDTETTLNADESSVQQIVRNEEADSRGIEVRESTPMPTYIVGKAAHGSDFIAAKFSLTHR